VKKFEKKIMKQEDQHTESLKDTNTLEIVKKALTGDYNEESIYNHLSENLKRKVIYIPCVNKICCYDTIRTTQKDTEISSEANYKHKPSNFYDINHICGVKSFL